MAKKNKIDITAVKETTSNEVIVDDMLFVDDSLVDIDDALSDALDEQDTLKDNKDKALKEKASKKRQEVNTTMKELGIKTQTKQSQFPTRSHEFLSKPVSDRGIHLVLNHTETEIYKDGADLCPRILMGIPAYGKSCKKNAFEHLINAQDKLKEARGEDPKKAPNWIIISNDSSMISDRNLLTRLEELKATTYVACPFGFNQIRSSGRWYNMDKSEQAKSNRPQNPDMVRGCYIQASSDSIDWNFVLGSGFTEKPRYRTLIAHGPFIAVRGELFMQIDFKYMAEHSDSGFYHYMADISLECHKRGYMIGQIKTTSIQFENVVKAMNTREIQVDQSCFTSKWQKMLPIESLP